eukprot:gene3197-3670_t
MKAFMDRPTVIVFDSDSENMGESKTLRIRLGSAYQEYVYDGASLGYTEGLEQLAQDFDMHQPSVNKWSQPISFTRKTSIGEESNESNNSLPSRKYDPCVSFTAGAPVIKKDVKFSLTLKHNQSNSNSSSGDSTPSARQSSASSPPIKVKKKVDSCVSFVAGKPILASELEKSKRLEEARAGGVNPVSLGNALKTFQNETNAENNTTAKKGRVVVKQHFDQDALQLAKPESTPAADRVRYTYSNTGVNNKKSAISVLREDFREPSSADFLPPENGDEQSLSSPEATFHLSVAVTEREATEPKISPSYSRDLISRGQRARTGGNLTSLTSQATLVQSKNGPVPKVPFDRNESARKGHRNYSNIAHQDREMQNKRRIQADQKGSKIGFVLSSRNNSSYYHQTHKMSSSSDLSDDDSVSNKDTDATSADEGDPSSRKGSRRVSYLMATATTPTVTMPHKLSDVSNPEADDEDSDAVNNSNLQRQYSQESVETEEDDRSLPAIQEGWLNKKLVHSSDGRKRASSRTWKSLYAVLRGHFLYCYKDKVEEGFIKRIFVMSIYIAEPFMLDGTSYDEEQMQVINLKGSMVDIAHDYAKRKHVLRLTTHTGSEFLFQAPDTQSLMAWVNSLRESNPEKDANGNAYENVIVRRMKSYEGETNTTTGTSPPGQTKSNNSKKGLSLKKTHFTLGYKNTKKRGFVNIHISHPKDKDVQATGFTFGIPLDQCPPGKDNRFVPVMVEHCCRVVEEKGLDYLGIYRVPGNAAAVQQLQEELDTKDPENINFDEDKWHDLNNIGSLLKSFLRKLPEPLIPKEMYSKFIQANREEDSNDRLRCLKNLVRGLPDYHGQTLRFLTMHLRQIADHSEKNKMEPKNLAIVFGPTVVRTSDENMVSMVKDMSDQCRIIETLIHQADWIYADDDSIEQVVEETVKPVENDGKCYVASKGLMESLGQMAESYDGGDQPTKGKDKQSVASAIMSLTNFTSGISMKIRNKAMSPVFSKKMGKGEQSFGPDQDACPANGNEEVPYLRRMGSDPQILSSDLDPPSKPSYRSEGEMDEDQTRVKSRIKSKYSRALPLGPATPAPTASGPTTSGPTAGTGPTNQNRAQMKPDTGRSKSDETQKPPVANRGATANIRFQIPVRAEVTVREDAKQREANLDSYKAAMLSEKTKLRLQQVSNQHQAAIDHRQIEKDKIDRERERTLRDLRQDEDDSIGDDSTSPTVLRDSDTISSTSDSNSSSRKESLDSLPSPLPNRKYRVPLRSISAGSSVSSSDEKSPSYALTPEEIEQREQERRQLDLFLGQFESIDEDKKLSSPTAAKPMTSVENLGAKSLDEKLRILLDPNYQEKDGKLVRRGNSDSNKVSSANGRANFAASIRGLNKPLKTKVIGLSAAKVNSPMYYADMAARFDTFKQKKQELEKKVSSILQDSSKTTKDHIYESDLNKTDEQKVASLRQKTQQQVRPFELKNPNMTQRVLVSAGDVPASPSRVAKYETYENPLRESIDSSWKRLDRNVQQVVELLQESHMDELTGENSELAALLNNLQRQASTDSKVANSNWPTAKRNLTDGIDSSRSSRSATVTTTTATSAFPSMRNDLKVTSLNTPTAPHSRHHDNTNPDLVRVQEWRTGPPITGQSSMKYSKMYPR